ncbi:MAG: SRPBCC family protein [Saprospiraceae bacterium]
MKENLTASASISLDATPSKVWEALTNPKLIKQYMFGTEVTTDWKEGNPITWKGEYEGKSYKDKGVIKKIEANKILQHTYLSGMTGKEDKPENYATVTYKLSKENDKTMLSLSQDNNENEKAKEGSTKNWNTVLAKLKEVVENK